MFYLVLFIDIDVLEGLTLVRSISEGLETITF